MLRSSCLWSRNLASKTTIKFLNKINDNYYSLRKFQCQIGTNSNILTVSEKQRIIGGLSFNQVGDNNSLIYGNSVAVIDLPDDATVYVNSLKGEIKTNKLIIKKFLPIEEFLNKISKKNLLKYMVRNPEFLECIEDQTEKFYTEVVRQKGSALCYIKPENQTEMMCSIAVKKDPNAFCYTTFQTPEMCLEVIKEASWLLKYVRSQTDEICLEAVSKNGFVLNDVKKQTREICLAAVNQIGYALQYVFHQTEEICMASVKKHGGALRYVENKTEAICLEAVKQDNSALQYVPRSMRENILNALKN